MSAKITSGVQDWTAPGIYLSAADCWLRLLNEDGLGSPVFDLWDIGEATLKGLQISPAAGAVLELAIVTKGVAQLVGETLEDQLAISFLRNERDIYVYSANERDRELARFSGGSWRCRDQDGNVLAGEVLLATRELIDRVWSGERPLEVGHLGPRSRPSSLATLLLG